MRVASTIMVVDSTYYGAAADLANQSGLADTSKMNGNELAFADTQGTQYKSYWKNLGESNWSAGYASQGDISAAVALDKIKQLHNGKLNELYYYCDICSIKSSSPGPCMCCREPVHLVEDPVK